MQSHEKNYGISEMEALAVVWAVKHFRCDVYTYHSALKALLNTPHPSGKLARSGMAIQEFDLTIYHHAGKYNSNADALSRAPVPTNSSSSVDMEDTFGIISAINAEDCTSSGLIQSTVTGPRLSGDNHLPQDRGITEELENWHCQSHSISLEIMFYTMWEEFYFQHSKLLQWSSSLPQASLSERQR